MPPVNTKWRTSPLAMSPRAIAMLLTLGCPVLMSLCFKCFSVSRVCMAWPPPKKSTCLNLRRQRMSKVALRGLCMSEHGRFSFIQGWGTQKWFLVCVCVSVDVGGKKVCSNIGSFKAHVSRQKQSKTHNDILSIAEEAQPNRPWSHCAKNLDYLDVFGGKAAVSDGFSACLRMFKKVLKSHCYTVQVQTGYCCNHLGCSSKSTTPFIHLPT